MEIMYFTIPRTQKQGNAKKNRRLCLLMSAYHKVKNRITMQLLFKQ